MSNDPFNKFLHWLHPDRDEAAKKYEDLRRHLIVIFRCRGCVDAEGLADQTIDRVTRRAHDLVDTYVGDPAPYCIKVAHNLFLEVRPRLLAHVELPAELPQHVADDDDDGPMNDCLERCMQHLSPANRQMVVEFYQKQKQAKIDHRKRLAEEMGIGIKALRTRVHRVRRKLHQCIEDCLSSVPAM